MDVRRAGPKDVDGGAELPNIENGYNATTGPAALKSR